MESHAREQGCGGLRALGTAGLIAALLFALAYGAPAAYAQAGQGQAVPAPNPPAGPADPVQEQINSLSQRRDELAQKARQRESQLAELANDTNVRRERLVADLRRIHDQMCGVEKDLVRLAEQSRQQMEGQVARAQNRARSLIEQAAALRAEASEVQAQIAQAQAQNRRQAEMIASALEQTRRQIRATEERLNGVEITYQARVESPVSNQPLPVEDRRLAGAPAESSPSVPPAARRLPPIPAEALRNLQAEIGQLRLEMQSTGVRMQELANRPQPPDPTIKTDLQQLRLKLDAVQQQVQQTQEMMERRVPVDNPYCVGSAGWGPYRNGSW